MDHKVFISHSSKDTWVAKRIAEGIERCGAGTFLDQANVQHGDDFEEVILQAEEVCSELLVLLTPWALTRSFIWLEIGFFRRGRKRIVGVLHGLAPKELSAEENVSALLSKLDLVELNDIDTYFTQLRDRVGASVHVGRESDV